MPKPASAGRPACALALLAVGLGLLAGCTASQYRKSADKEVYGIIKQAEATTFGRTNAFTIDTLYSGRKPEEIPPEELIDERLGGVRRLLSLETALSLAVTNSREYQSAKETLYRTALSLTEQRYEFGPKFSASSRARLERTGDPRIGTVPVTTTNSMGQPVTVNTPVQDSPVSVSGSVNNQLQVSQLLKSGGLLTATLANDLFRYYTGDPERMVVSTLSVDLVQPLLRGFGKNNPAVEALKQAERNVVYAVRDYSFFQAGFAVGIVNDYFELLSQKDVVRNRYTNYLSRAQLTKRMEARARDREELNAVDQARQAELSARNQYVSSVAAYQTLLDNFKLTLGLPVGERLLLDDSALTELQQAGLVPTPLPVEAAYRLATERQMEVLNTIDIFEDSKRKVRVAANQLKADLNLFADATWQSEGPTDYTKFNPNDIRAGVGLELNLPLDRLRERNQYRATLVAFEEAVRGLTARLDELREAIEGGIRDLNLIRESYRIQQNALELANRRVASTTLLLQAGRAEVRDLLEAQDAQISAQIAVTRELVAYLRSRLQLMLDIGALQTEQPQFWLMDHLAGFMPQTAPVESAAAMPDQPVIPPEEFFNQ